MQARRGGDSGRVRSTATPSGGTAQRDQVDDQIELGGEPMQRLDAVGDRIVEGDLADVGARPADR